MIERDYNLLDLERLIEGKGAQCFPLLSRGVCMETYLCLSVKVKFYSINHLISESV